nr:uncharacterized protein LOC105845318 [Hydra vulgaris]
MKANCKQSTSMEYMIKKSFFLNLFIYFSLCFIFISYHECKFSSFINSNDVKANVTFVSMSRIAEARLVSDFILLNISVSHQSQCMNKCTKTTNCTSYNIFKESQNMFQCQLLSDNKYSNSNQLEKIVGWSHVSIQSIPCDRSPCKNNGTCKPDYTENSFFCICSAKYLGEFCETEMNKIISLHLNNLGCWKDDLNKAMVPLEGSSSVLIGYYQSRLNSIEMCYLAAKERGFPIFAVQDGGYCSASIDDLYKKNGLSNTCKKDGKGGVTSNQVYLVTEKLLYNYGGCWKDSSPYRAAKSLEGLNSGLSGLYKYRSNAITKCYNAAFDLNFEYFAIQDSGQCFAGNSSSYKIYGNANNCNADGKGGSLANAVYIINY